MWGILTVLLVAQGTFIFAATGDVSTPAPKAFSPLNYDQSRYCGEHQGSRNCFRFPDGYAWPVFDEIRGGIQLAGEVDHRTVFRALGWRATYFHVAGTDRVALVRHDRIKKDAFQHEKPSQTDEECRSQTPERETRCIRFPDGYRVKSSQAEAHVISMEEVNGRKVYLLQAGDTLYRHPEGLDYYESWFAEQKNGIHISGNSEPASDWLSQYPGIIKVSGDTTSDLFDRPMGYLPCEDLLQAKPYKVVPQARFFKWSSLSPDIRLGIQDATFHRPFVPPEEVAFHEKYFKQCEIKKRLIQIMGKRYQPWMDYAGIRTKPATSTRVIEFRPRRTPANARPVPTRTPAPPAPAPAPTLLF